MYERLKELCRSRGITISDLEKSLGFGTRTIYNWGTHAPSIDKVIAVAEYLGVSVDYLVLGKNGESAVADDLEGLTPEAREAVYKLIEALKK